MVEFGVISPCREQTLYRGMFKIAKQYSRIKYLIKY